MGGCRVHKLGPRDPLPTELSILTSTTPTSNVDVVRPFNGNMSMAPMHIPTSESVVTAGAPSVGPSRGPQQYAHPLNEMYAHAYVHQHKQRYETEQQIEADCQVALAKVNTIHACLWMQVCILFASFLTTY